jgi:hypothetical protein
MRVKFFKLKACFSIQVSKSYLLTPWNRVLPEKLTGSQLDKKFPVFYGTRRVITAFPVPAICPSHQDMARPRVADGERPTIRRVAVNIWNKQTRTVDKEWSSSLGLEEGLTTPHRKNWHSYETSTPATFLNHYTLIQIPSVTTEYGLVTAPLYQLNF